MDPRNRSGCSLSNWLSRCSVGSLEPCRSVPTGSTTAVPGTEEDVAALAATFNDDAIPFNDQLVVLGKPEAKVTAVLVFGLRETPRMSWRRCFRG